MWCKTLEIPFLPGTGLALKVFLHDATGNSIGVDLIA